MGTHHAADSVVVSARDLTFFRTRGYAPTPLLVQWLLSTSCSLSCPHCSAAVATPQHASLALATRLLDQVAAMRVPQLLLTGGEPLEHPHFADIVAELRARDIPWSLNSAVFPDRRAREAMEGHPPHFVAVSLDGPPELHDRFRGRPGACDDALRAIAWYRAIGVAGVAAGTTVTAINFPHLDELFATVLESGVTSWGLHLVVAEGRAAGNRRLLLSSSQTSALVRFVARRRSSFPVNMADEIGFCGDWEPLLRDTPFFCGAGRTQCVVLPEGEVVPCTTLDRSCSIGNVMTEELAALWAAGFGELRSWRPRGACRRCRHADACGGGCWLQRRQGQHCHRPAWERGRLPVAAACIGLVACASGSPTGNQTTLPSSPAPIEASAQASAAPDEPSTAAAPDSGAAPSRGDSQDERVFGENRPASVDIIEWAWIRHAAESPLSVCTPKAERTFLLAAASLDSDSLAVYYTALAQPSCSRSLPDRIAAIRAALQSTRRSMGLIATVWRDLQEWTLLESDANTRSVADREALRAQLAELGRTAAAWRAELFAKKLDPFLTPERAWGHAMRSKAGPPPGVVFLSELGEERWGPPDARARLTKRYLDQHPVAEGLTVSLRRAPGAAVVIVSPLGERTMRATDALGIFDVLRVPATAKAPVALTIVLRDGELQVSADPGVELGYLDLSKLALQGNRSAMESALQAGGVPDAFFIPLLRESALREGEGARSRSSRRLSAAWLF